MPKKLMKCQAILTGLPTIKYTIIGVLTIFCLGSAFHFAKRNKSNKFLSNGELAGPRLCDCYVVDVNKRTVTTHFHSFLKGTTIFGHNMTSYIFSLYLLVTSWPKLRFTTFE